MSNYQFTSTAGQVYTITGLNDYMACADAIAHTIDGRPFGRRNMKRLENTYGVKVEFTPDPAVDEDFDELEANDDYHMDDYGDDNYSRNMVERHDMWKREQ